MSSLEDEIKCLRSKVATSLKHYDTRIQSKPSPIYQKKDVRQLEGKLNPEGESFQCSKVKEIVRKLVVYRHRITLLSSREVSSSKNLVFYRHTWKKLIQ